METIKAKSNLLFFTDLLSWPTPMRLADGINSRCGSYILELNAVFTLRPPGSNNGSLNMGRINYVSKLSLDK